MTPEQQAKLERGQEVFAGNSLRRFRDFVRDIEPGTYTVRRTGQFGRRYVRLKPEVVERHAIEQGTPIGGRVTAPFFKKKTG